MAFTCTADSLLGHAKNGHHIIAVNRDSREAVSPCLHAQVLHRDSADAGRFSPGIVFYHEDNRELAFSSKIHRFMPKTQSGTIPAEGQGDEGPLFHLAS